MASSSQHTSSPSIGAFEAHVQSVRASRGLPHLVQTQVPSQVHIIPSRPVIVDGILPPRYTPSSTASRPSNDDKSETSSIRSMEKKRASSFVETPSGNRTTSDDGPEPKTLARILFLYGFFMPLFWIFGTSILFLDLAYHQTPEELSEDPRTDSERQEDLAVLRRAEVRWAWRSLYALVSLVVFLGSVLLIWAGATGKFTGVQN